MDTLALILALKALGNGGAIIVPTLPTTDIKDGVLYILSTDWTIHVHDTNGWHTVGGQEIDTNLFEFSYTNGDTSLERTIKGE